MFVLSRLLNLLSRFHRWVDLALLFKKGVGREIAVLEVPDNVFSNDQHSRNPVLKFCGRHTAGDLSQSTFCVQNFSRRLCLCSLKVNATLLQPCGSQRRNLRSSHERFLRDLLASVATKKNNARTRIQASGSNLQVLLTKFAPFVAKAR